MTRSRGNLQAEGFARQGGYGQLRAQQGLAEFNGSIDVEIMILHLVGGVDQHLGFDEEISRIAPVGAGAALATQADLFTVDHPLGDFNGQFFYLFTVLEGDLFTGAGGDLLERQGEFVD